MTPDEVLLWVHATDLEAGVTEHLRPDGCEASNLCTSIKEFSDYLEDLAEWNQGLASPQNILVTKESAYLRGASYAVFKAIKDDYVKLEDSLLLGTKSIKNEVWKLE